jgi:hypothetical protein
MARLAKALALSSLMLCTAASAAPNDHPAVTPIPCQRLIGHIDFRVPVTIISATPSNSFNGIQLPPFCRVIATAHPTNNSAIGIEVWVPANGNGKFEQFGNNGFAGGINYLGLMIGLTHGYASASTDDGHVAPASDPMWAGFAKDDTKLQDFASRAVKVTTDVSKRIFEALTGKLPAHSYFHGCSEGGREALLTAQQHPTDFDGMIVGAPANNWTHQFVSFAWNAKQIYSNPARPFTSILPQGSLSALSGLVHNQCVGHDGGLPSDAYLTDPRKCKVNLADIACANDAQPTSSCLTKAQRNLVAAIYQGPRTSNGTQVFPGLQPGNEDHACNWVQWITGQTSGQACVPGTPLQPLSMQGLFAVGFFENFMAGFNIHVNSFDLDSATVATDHHLANVLNATNTDLHEFRAHGGKIIQYHGWADGAVAPENSINYYTAVQTTMGNVDDFYRLFMVPGMSHCAGGVGPNVFGNIFESKDDADHSVLRALEAWVEQNKAPEKIIATKYLHDVPPPIDPQATFVADRPLCPYPKIAKKFGVSDRTAADFKCVMP